MLMPVPGKQLTSGNGGDILDETRHDDAQSFSASSLELSDLFGSVWGWRRSL